jgi:hypothetical protein
MASQRLTAAQRAKIPKSEFAITPGNNRSDWKYPMPSKATAKKIGMSETQRASVHQAAASYSARKDTAGSPAAIKRQGRKSGAPRKKKKTTS